MNTSSSKIARMVTNNSNAAAMPTPIHVQPDEDDIGAQREPFRVDPRELHVEIGADRKSDRGRRKNEFHQGGEAGNEAAVRPKGAARVGEGAAGMRNGGRSSVKLKIKVVYIGRNQHRGNQKAECAGGGPAVAPPEILARDDQSDRDAPELKRTQHLLQANGVTRR